MRRIVIVLATSLVVGPAFGQDADFSQQRLRQWHQWRGPLATGVAPLGDPPVVWSENRNVAWKTPLPGDGTSSPVIWGDRVFVTTAVRTDRGVATLPPPAAEPPGGYKTPRPRNYYRFVVLCLDRGDGSLLWQQTATEQLPHEGHHATHGYASASATTDGNRLYVSFGSRGLFCYDLNGRLLWQRNLGNMITRFGWGEASSPVIHEDSLIVNWDHEGESSIHVLNAANGETRWTADRDEISSWSTPLVVDGQGKTQVIVSATRRVTSYALDDGSIVWECGGQTVNCIPSPVAADGVIYCMSGYGGSALCAIPLDARGDVTGSDQIRWTRERGTPYVPSPLLTGDLLYFTKTNQAVLTLLDARSGEAAMAEQRLPGLQTIYASPVSAAGRVYFVDRNGTTLVLKQGRTFEVLATNTLDDPIDASPAIVGRQLFLRSHGSLYCISDQSRPSRLR